MRISAGIPTILGYSCGLPQFVQASAGIAPNITQTARANSFLIHYSHEIVTGWSWGAESVTK